MEKKSVHSKKPKTIKKSKKSSTKTNKVGDKKSNKTVEKKTNKVGEKRIESNVVVVKPVESKERYTAKVKQLLTKIKDKNTFLENGIRFGWKNKS
jgi:hypothetical protein